MMNRLVISFAITIILLNTVNASKSDQHLKNILKSKRLSQKDPENTVLSLIQRVIGTVHDINDFIIKFDQALNANDELDTFQLEMDDTGQKLVITANSVIAATWGFNYYLKYYCNSSVFWSGKNINIYASSLPKVQEPVKIAASDHLRYYQNVVTYSYSYVWWDWSRWEYEIDWMALNGINFVLAHTASEFVWLSVFQKLGFTRTEIDSFFTGPAYLGWLRMGNMKRFGGSLTDSWHADQVSLQKQIIQRMKELGINYVLPTFAGFVPDSITRLYPNNNFTASKDWNGFGCNYSCDYIVDPKTPLFTTIGNLYVQEITSTFGTGHFYSADVFNEMDPQSADLTYLAEINQAIYQAMSTADPQAVWVMQAWLFGSSFWSYERVQAFLSKVPIGRLILLDLFSEVAPYYQRFSSFFGHLFVWNMLHDFGGANGLFGQISSINSGPDVARSYPNSTMVGIGITMEGINQNELVYEFMLEKAWRHTLDSQELFEWVNNYTNRRYYYAVVVSYPIQVAMQNITFSVFDNAIYDVNNRQLFTRRPRFGLNIEDKPYIDELYVSWKVLVQEAQKHHFYLSPLFKYDLVDITKEVLRYKFSEQYVQLTESYNYQDLDGFANAAGMMLEILNDTEWLLASDSHFLLGNWLESAKAKATNEQELDYYEWNARLQITVWGQNYTTSLFDYACKGWSGLVNDYYLKRWKIFLDIAQKSLVEGKPIDSQKLNEKLYLEAELPFATSKSIYPTNEIGDSFSIIQTIYQKYRF